MTRRAKLLGLDARSEAKVVLTEDVDWKNLDMDVVRITKAFEKAQELGLDLFSD
jgi:hypothetical protein